MNLLERALSGCSIRVMGLDPGQTTGACVFVGPTILDHCQLPTGLMPEAPAHIRDYIAKWTPDVIVMEDYRVYSWKADSHSWMALHTPKVIGAIEYLCWNEGRRLVRQMAGEGKAFVSDDKLHKWGLWYKGEQHARDAIRHAIHYLLFKVATINCGLDWQGKLIPREEPNHGST